MTLEMKIQEECRKVREEEREAFALERQALTSERDALSSEIDELSFERQRTWQRLVTEFGEEKARSIMSDPNK